MATIEQIGNIKIIGNLKYSNDLRLCLGPTKNDAAHIYNIIPECEIIESKAFMDTKIENIIFPKNLYSIKSSAFFKANFKNKTLDFKDTNLEIIGDSAFELANIEEVKFPNTLSQIDDRGFEETRLKSIDLSNTNLETLGLLALACNYDLTSIKLPKSLLYIGDGVFESCKKLEEINFENTSVSTIRRNAFNYCESLKQLKLPESVKVIGSRAFAETALKEIVFPKNVIEVDINAFEDSQIETLYTKADFLIKSFLGQKEFLKLKEIICNKNNKNMEAAAKIWGADLKINFIDNLLEKSNSFKEINNIFKDIER